MQVCIAIKIVHNIANIPELNFKRYIERAKTEIKNWSSRNITPFGKITVIKTFVISPFVHLFLTIPTSHQFIKDLNNLLYKFLWNNKPDKINRETVCSDYFEGGLKMVNIFNFERALKLSWIRKLYTMAEKPWYYLFFSTYDNFAKFFKLGVGWTKFLLKAGKNKFWQQVFENWITLNSFHKVQTNTDIMESIIWYNTDIFKTDIYYPHWFKKGIHCIGDLVKSSGKFFNMEEIEQKYDLKVNFLYYNKLKHEIGAFIETYKKGNKFQHRKPYIPFHLKLLIQNLPGCKDFYKVLNDKNKAKPPLCETKWSTDLDIPQETSDWLYLYKSCFKAVSEMSIIWFQYKILFRILDRKDYLYKVKLNDCNLCSFCKEVRETIIHIFTQCTKVQDLWKNVKCWIQNKIGMSLHITNIMKIIGYPNFDQNYWPLNFILISTRYYIYRCAKTNQILNIFFLQKEIKRRYLEHKYLAKIKQNSAIFNKRWESWKNIFIDV